MIAYRSCTEGARPAPFTRRNLNAQGFDWLDDDAKARYALPLRFTPAVGTIMVVFALTLRSPIWVGAMALVALSGAVLPRGMFIDLTYNLGVRHLFRAQPLPPVPRPRQFSYLLSAALLASSALALHRGLLPLGYILGGAVVLGGTVLTTTLFCLGSLFYGLLPRQATQGTGNRKRQAVKPAPASRAVVAQITP